MHEEGVVFGIIKLVALVMCVITFLLWIGDYGC